MVSFTRVWTIRVLLMPSDDFVANFSVIIFIIFFKSTERSLGYLLNSKNVLAAYAIAKVDFWTSVIQLALNYVSISILDHLEKMFWRVNWWE